MKNWAKTTGCVMCVIKQLQTYAVECLMLLLAFIAAVSYINLACQTWLSSLLVTWPLHFDI